MNQFLCQRSLKGGFSLAEISLSLSETPAAAFPRPAGAAAAGAADGVPVDFEVVDAQEIPYADASYDAITMAYGIRNMPDRPRALSEMYRVLKPGGSLVCLEFSTPPNAVWRALYNFYLKHLIPFWGGLITGDRDGFVYLSKSIKAFPNQQGLARMMEDAGFTDVTWKNYTGGIAAVHVAKKPE